jgi:hypothetical protein
LPLRPAPSFRIYLKNPISYVQKSHIVEGVAHGDPVHRSLAD